MREMNLRLTLMDSAQAFHWRKIGGAFAAVVDGRVLTSADEDAFARAYFDDARDYSRLMEDCASYPVAARAVQATPGLRVLNQPPWEALLQFILSANNNVARIRALVTALNETYGEAHAFQGETLHGFPKPEVLANLTEAELRARVTCGYRAAYLIGTARMVADGFPLNALSAMPIERAREELMRLPGVGPKVADCVLLFGCRHARRVSGGCVGEAADGRLVRRDRLARVSGAGGAADVRGGLRAHSAVAVPRGARGAD